MEETVLVEALLRTTQKLFVEGQLDDPDGYSWAEQEEGEEALIEWLDEQSDPPAMLAQRVLSFLMLCEARRVS